MINGLPARPFSLRQILLALVVIGIVALTIELLLLRHTESFSQWIPLAVLAVGLVSAILVAFRPGRDTVRSFQVVMAVFVLTGLLGLYFHYRGNLEFALERDPSATGLRLVWKALTGATPTLAPGALAQLGLFGLAYTYRRTDVTNRSKAQGEGVE